VADLTELSRSPWARGLGIVLRTAHLGAMAVLVGGAVLGGAGPALGPWRVATVATGLALLLIEASHSRNWIHQGRGVLTLLHVAALGLILPSATAGRAAVFAALVLGAVGSHLPRGLRKWSLRDRRVLD
jgi:hypothetical protein